MLLYYNYVNLTKNHCEIRNISILKPPLSFSGELKHVLNLSKPKLVFCSPETVEKMVKILPDHPYIKQLVLFGPEKYNHPKITMYNPIIAGADEQEYDDSYEPVKLNPFDSVATILCSSGTTGMPKGVMCTHESMCAYVDIMRYKILLKIN